MHGMWTKMIGATRGLIAGRRRVVVTDRYRMDELGRWRRDAAPSERQRTRRRVQAAPLPVGDLARVSKQARVVFALACVVLPAATSL